MLEHLKDQPADKILALMAAFRADPRDDKVDLGVGVYKDATGNTPVMRAVKEAERRLVAEQTTKAYTGLAGDPAFSDAMIDLILGGVVPRERIAAVATPGGTGAIRQALELIKLAAPEATVWLSDPTWPNHPSIIKYLGMPTANYRYFDDATRGVDFAGLMADLGTVASGDVVLLHGCCHNPTGADLSNEQWDQIADLALERGFIPFIDTAYQGLGNGLNEDAYGMRMMAERLPELVIASSCSKNFGLYRERTGSITFIAENPQQVDIVASQAMSIARQIYSMPPAHGALLVSLILGDDQLRANWQAELEEVRLRIKSMRSLLTSGIQGNLAGIDFSHIEQQNGMFSFLGISSAQLERLREEFGIYIVSSTRVNLAGINSSNIGYISESMNTVLK